MATLNKDLEVGVTVTPLGIEPKETLGTVNC